MQLARRMVSINAISRTFFAQSLCLRLHWRKSVKFFFFNLFFFALVFSPLFGKRLFARLWLVFAAQRSDELPRFCGRSFFAFRHAASLRRKFISVNSAFTSFRRDRPRNLRLKNKSNSLFPRANFIFNECL